MKRLALYSSSACWVMVQRLALYVLVTTLRTSSAWRYTQHSVFFTERRGARRSTKTWQRPSAKRYTCLRARMPFHRTRQALQDALKRMFPKDYKHHTSDNQNKDNRQETESVARNRCELFAVTIIFWENEEPAPPRAQNHHVCFRCFFPCSRTYFSFASLLTNKINQ